MKSILIVMLSALAFTSAADAATGRFAELRRDSAQEIRKSGNYSSKLLSIDGIMLDQLSAGGAVYTLRVSLTIGSTEASLQNRRHTFTLTAIEDGGARKQIASATTSTGSRHYPTTAHLEGSIRFLSDKTYEIVATWSGNSDAEAWTQTAENIVLSYEVVDEGPLMAQPNDRFRECRTFGDSGGAVLDSVTGIVWLQDGTCQNGLTWQGAKNAAAALGDGVCGLSDGSGPGDWRLPTKDEWQQMREPSVVYNCEQKIPNREGTGCHSDGTEIFKVRPVDTPAFYWTVDDAGPGRAWYIQTNLAAPFGARKTERLSSWAVRDGPCPRN